MAHRVCVSMPYIRFNLLYSNFITSQRQSYKLNKIYFLKYSSKANQSTKTEPAATGSLLDPINKTLPNNSLSKDKEHVVSDWIKEIQKTDDRPPITYRRQDYPDPIRRTIGILSDDLRLFYASILNFSKELKKFVKGEHPYERSGKKNTDDQLKIDQENSGVTSTTKTPETSNGLEDTGKNLLERQLATHSINRKKSQSKVKTLLSSMRSKEEVFPSYCDVLIVGGGAMGSSIAYHIKQTGRDSLNVVVLEKDPTVSSYTR